MSTFRGVGLTQIYLLNYVVLIWTPQTPQTALTIGLAQESSHLIGNCKTQFFCQSEIRK
jgi:hypothetical protein